MGKTKGHVPVRTCISCGARKKKRELIRLSLNGDRQVIRDDIGREQGRGAYVCNHESCLGQLSRNKRLRTIFRSNESITLSPSMEGR